MIPVGFLSVQSGAEAVGAGHKGSERSPRTFRSRIPRLSQLCSSKCRREAIVGVINVLVRQKVKKETP